MPNLPSWLETAVFYQIYPQSFYDSNGDGIGDLPGILAKMDYIQSLGVTALWLNPCFVSPFQDAGYDVADYYNVAPRYGTNEDLKRLFEEARQRGIRILLDLVPGHTSIEHPWFKAWARHERNPYTDWYIWTDSVWATRAPPMQAVRAYAERDGSYITNFFYSQPALNYGFARPDPAHPWQQPVDAPGPQAVRALIALRKQHPALWASAAFEPLYAEAGRYPLVYRRQGTGETLLIALNPSERNVEISLPMDICPDPHGPKNVYGLSSPWMRRGEDEWVLTLPPVSGGIYQV